MKRPLLWILLAVSLTFNVFFALGLYRAVSEPRTLEEKTEAFAEQLGLSPEQRVAYDAWRKAYLADRNERRAGNIGIFDRAINELMKDEPDEAVIDACVDAASGPEARRRTLGHIRALMQILTPEQRKTIVGLFRAGRPPVPPEKAEKPKKAGDNGDAE